MVDRLRALEAARLHLWLMLVLTFTTGINDAVGYLGLDKVFTGNMTGNVVVLGMAIAGGSGLPVVGPVLALVGFMAGAAIGGRALKGTAAPWNRRTTVMFGLVALVMIVLSVVLFVAGNHPSHSLGVVVTTSAALAMGMQAATARVIAVKDVTTVVVTSTITGLAADSWFGAGIGGGSARRAIAIVAILVGALLGALLLKWHLAGGLLVAGIVIAAVATVGDLHARGLAEAREH